MDSELKRRIEIADAHDGERACASRNCFRPTGFLCYFIGGPINNRQLRRRLACEFHAEMFARLHGLAMPGSGIVMPLATSPGWDQAIADAQKGIDRLKRVIKVCRAKKAAGELWPGSTE